MIAKLNLTMDPSDNTLSRGVFQRASPLWTRAPQRDEAGRAYSDFMLLIPGLKQQSEASRQVSLALIRQCLRPFDDTVVYVDLNIKLSLLWISHKPEPGMTVALVQAIQRALPQARIIAADFNIQTPDKRQPQRSWLSLLGLRLRNGVKRLR